MGDAKRDANYITTLIAVSNVDGLTPVVLYADPVTHRLLVSSAGGLTLLVATGLVNGVNTDFVFSEQPDYIVSDGAWYKVNKGWTWNAGTLTATMTIPPNDDIYAFT